MLPIYLSTSTPRWTPKTESDIRDAITNGLIEETHHTEVKEALDTTRGDNRELARDLAFLAVDGGTLIIGLAENRDTSAFTLAPQRLKGLPEKIEQVARTIPDPPLNIVSSTIASDTDPTAGYVIVQIPESPGAPHMVDKIYYGRSDKTKTKLSDAEVLRLHQRRRVAEQDAMNLLNAEIADDPIKDESGIKDENGQGHLFLLTVANPGLGPRALLAVRNAAGSPFILGGEDLRLSGVRISPSTPMAATRRWRVLCARRRQRRP